MKLNTGDHHSSLTVLALLNGVDQGIVGGSTCQGSSGPRHSGLKMQ